MNQPVVSLRIFKETDINLSPYYRAYKQMISWLDQNGLRTNTPMEENAGNKERYVAFLCAQSEQTRQYNIPLAKALMEINHHDFDIRQPNGENKTANLGTITFSDISINPNYVNFKLTNSMINGCINELNIRLNKENKPSLVYAQVVLPAISPIESSLKESGFVTETEDYPTYTNRDKRETSLIRPANLDAYQMHSYKEDLSSARYEDTKQAVCATYINKSLQNCVGEQTPPSTTPQTPKPSEQ